MLAALLFLALLPLAVAQPEDKVPTDTVPRKPAEAAEGFQWKPALIQSGVFLGVQYASRMAQKKTRRDLGSPFWSEYFESVSNIHTWSDQDGIPTNYVGHPMIGAVTRTLTAEFHLTDLSLQLSRTRAYPAILPLLHLDHIYYDHHLKAKKAFFHRTALSLVASDHLPLVADFSMAQ